MKVESVTVERKFNLGNYNSRGISVTIAPNTDDSEHSINDLIAYVDMRIEAYNTEAENKKE